MIGLFQENGPCGVDSDGNVYSNPYSWNNASNMIYIDQPTQVGLSYSIPVPGYLDPTTGDLIVLPSTSCPDYAADWSCGTYPYGNASLTANSTANAAPYFYRALQGFMGAFPQYSRESFHFTTESYGGHYGPVFNEYIEEQNKDLQCGAKKISLESVLIGNGWYDPIVQYAAYYNFTVRKMDCILRMLGLMISGFARKHLRLPALQRLDCFNVVQQPLGPRKLHRPA